MSAFSGRLRPTFLIIGAQKSGTTALFEYLSAHPDIASPTEKEINFFMCPTLYAQGLEFYEKYFPQRVDPTKKQITFEASPNYLVSADAPKRIFEFDPAMKLIVLLRDPVLRAYSAWSMYQRFFRKKPNWYFDWMQRCDASVNRASYVCRHASFGESFLADIQQELTAREQNKPIEGPILRHGFYAEQIAIYQTYFPNDQFYIECNERLRQEPKAVLGEIEEFLGMCFNDWKEDLLQPVFVGDHKNAPPADAVERLKSIYQDRNSDLFSQLGKTFPWI